MPMPASEEDEARRREKQREKQREKKRRQREKKRAEKEKEETHEEAAEEKPLTKEDVKRVNEQFSGNRKMNMQEQVDARSVCDVAPTDEPPASSGVASSNHLSRPDGVSIARCVVDRGEGGFVGGGHRMAG